MDTQNDTSSNNAVAPQSNLMELEPSSSKPQGDSQSGIDVRQALEILSSRTPNERPGVKESNLLKNMGQTIDLYATSSDSRGSLPENSTTQNQTTKPIATVDSSANSIEHRQKTRESMKGLSLTELLKVLLKAHEDRVKTYRLYDAALEKVLVSSRLTDYPPACVAATAAFSVLSNTVTAVRDELSDRKKESTTGTSTLSSVITWINDLQDSEKQKLQLTAAYHLEQIRANNLKKSNASGDNEEDGDAQGIDERELLLLQNGISDMRSKIGTCISDINSIIEDLRCTLVEEVEKEEEL